MILLDTCALVWLTGDPPKLSDGATKLLRDSDSLFVSSVTAFEIAFGVKKGRLQLPLFSEDWFDETLDYFRIQEISVSSRIYLDSVDLPAIHQDPADRILIATARQKNLILLTPDSKIRQYPGIRCEW